MKKVLLMTAVVCLLAISALAQKKTDFSGSWTLDVSKSKLDERARVESMTKTVTQTDKDIKIETATKRLPPPDGAMQGGGGNGQGGGGGMGGGRGMGRGFGGDGTFTYTLDGKESSTETEGPMGKMPLKLKASLEADGNLKLSSSSTFSGQMGEMTITSKETWSLSADGKTLTIKSERESPRGTSSSEMVFTKK